jgi:hypothetical protein
MRAATSCLRAEPAATTFFFLSRWRVASGGGRAREAQNVAYNNEKSETIKLPSSKSVRSRALDSALEQRQNEKSSGVNLRQKVSVARTVIDRTTLRNAVALCQFYPNLLTFLSTCVHALKIHSFL